MKTIEEMIAVMQAYADGKKIECKGNVRPEPWCDCFEPVWNWDYCDYRVKAEPKYRPYAYAEECFKDVLKHGGWVKSKPLGFYFHISKIGRLGVTYIDQSYEIFEDCLDQNVWADDGTPCGVKEE